MRHVLLASASLLLTAAATAQLTHTIPNGTATAAGNSSNAFPWGSSAPSWPGLRLMAVYDTVNFTQATPPINYPIVISRLKWRVNDGVGSWSGGTYAAATVEMSTAAVDWTAVTTNYATNHGADRQVVYQGPVTFNGGTGVPAGVVPPYVVDIALQTPFVYDPGAGDLCIDVDYLGGNNFSGNQGIQMDVQSVNANASRVFASSMYPVANGTTTSHGPVVEFEYLPTAGYGIFQTYGVGCGGGGAPGVYEQFDGAANVNDLQNSGISLQFVGNTYVALQGAAPITPPTGTPLALASNQTLQVPLPFALPYQGGTTNSLWICSNGWIALDSTTATTATGSVGAMRFGPPIVAAWWDDLDPSTAGAVHAQADPAVGGVFHVTWTNVPETRLANQNTFQVTFSSSGAIDIKWGSMGSTAGLTGFHPGRGGDDPGPTDLSQITALVLGDGTRSLALAAALGSRPVLGATFNSEIREIPAAAGLGVMVLGLNQLLPGIDLGPVGAPGCTQYASLDAPFIFLPSGPLATVPVALPGDPSFAGVKVYSQAAVFAATANPLGVLTTNGGDWTVDIN